MIVNEPRHIVVPHLIRQKLEEAQARFGGEIFRRHGWYWLWIPKNSDTLKRAAFSAGYKLYGRRNDKRATEGRREPDYTLMTLYQLLRTENDPDKPWRGAVRLSQRLSHSGVISDSRKLNAVEKQIFAMAELFPSVEDLLNAPEDPNQVAEMNVWREVLEWRERRKASAQMLRKITVARKPRRRRRVERMAVA